MEDTMTAKFWWRLRDIWHYPQFLWMAYRLNHIWWWSYYYMLSHKKYKMVFHEATKDTRGLFWKYYWGFWYLQPLRCNGDRGGWRTKLCDWLKIKASQKEK